MHFAHSVSLCVARKCLLLFFRSFSHFHLSDMRDSSTESQCENILKKKTKINKDRKVPASSLFPLFAVHMLSGKRIWMWRNGMNIASNNQDIILVSCTQYPMFSFMHISLEIFISSHHSSRHIVLAHIIYLMTWLKPFQTIAQLPKKMRTLALLMALACFVFIFIFILISPFACTAQFAAQHTHIHTHCRSINLTS